MAEAGSIEIPVNVRFQMRDAWAEGYAQGRDDEAHDEPLRTVPGQRVVLVKPGDVLIFGRVGPIAPDMVKPVISTLEEKTGVKVVLFTADIDMAAVPGCEHGEGG